MTVRIPAIILIILLAGCAGDFSGITTSQEAPTTSQTASPPPVTQTGGPSEIAQSFSSWDWKTESTLENLTLRIKLLPDQGITCNSQISLSVEHLEMGPGSFMLVRMGPDTLIMWTGAGGFFRVHHGPTDTNTLLGSGASQGPTGGLRFLSKDSGAPIEILASMRLAHPWPEAQRTDDYMAHSFRFQGECQGNATIKVSRGPGFGVWSPDSASNGTGIVVLGRGHAELDTLGTRLLAGNITIGAVITATAQQPSAIGRFNFTTPKDSEEVLLGATNGTYLRDLQLPGQYMIQVKAAGTQYVAFMLATETEASLDAILGKNKPQ